MKINEIITEGYWDNVDKGFGINTHPGAQSVNPAGAQAYQTRQDWGQGIDNATAAQTAQLSARQEQGQQAQQQRLNTLTNWFTQTARKSGNRINQSVLNNQVFKSRLNTRQKQDLLKQLTDTLTKQGITVSNDIPAPLPTLDPNMVPTASAPTAPLSAVDTNHINAAPNPEEKAVRQQIIQKQQQAASGGNPSQRTNTIAARKAGFNSISDYYADMNRRLVNPDKNISAQAQRELAQYTANVKADKAAQAQAQNRNFPQAGPTGNYGAGAAVPSGGQTESIGGAPWKMKTKLTEGGNAIPESVPVNKEDVAGIIATAKSLLPQQLLKNLQADIGSAGYKLQSGDIDLMVEAADVIRFFKTENEKDPVKAAKKAFEAYLVKKGVRVCVNGRNVSIAVPYKEQSSRQNKVAQVDLMVIHDANIVAPYHQHGPRGMYDTDAEFKGQPIFILMNSIGKALNLKFDAFGAKLMDRDTNNVVARDRDAVAKILLNKKATADDLNSVKTILRALENDPKREAKLAQAREDAKKGLINLPEMV